MVQKIVGTLNWYRIYVPNLSSRIANITELLKNKNNNIRWLKEHNSVMQEITQEIIANAHLKLPNYGYKL